MPPEPGPRPEPSIEDLTDTGRAVSLAEVRDAMTASMGLGPNPVQRPPDRPDGTSWRRTWGWRDRAAA